uniref:PCIF1 WW domain-containing protein n=2 Tax=Emiliania huxleyi TaxID=2903 RepID=A0A7S3TRY3_EMIHU
MPPAAAERFPEVAFCVVARQLSLQGGHEGAGGMQAACPPSVFETLRQDLGVTRELFASPLNCAFPRFCSASADVDADFGSAGSFFLYTPRPGAYLANPPFDPAVVAAMAVRMEAPLDARRDGPRLARDWREIGARYDQRLVRDGPRCGEMWRE